jgi:uncharacterized repeat protein (TIGR01451 family)
MSTVILTLSFNLEFTQAQAVPTPAADPIDPNPVSQELLISMQPTLITAFTDPVNCNQLTPPVIGIETSKGQSANDMSVLLTNLAATGYSIGSVNISTGPIPACVDVLLVRGLAGDIFLPTPYSAAEGVTLRNWVAAGHGLMIASDFGTHTGNTQPLFQPFGYTLANGAATDSDDFDNTGPLNYWVIYQSDNFTSHPILNSVNTLELLASSWFSPAANAIVTTDNNATANPANMPVLAAFTEEQGCVVLSADSNWMANSGNGYLKANNALAARQMINWLNGCFSLSLQKSASAHTAQPGELITFTIQAANYTTSSLTGIQITDAVPAGTSFVSASNPHTGPDGSGVVTWNVGSLGVNASTTVEMVVQLNNDLANGVVITNTAFVVSSQGPSDSATALVTVDASQPTAVAGGPYQVNEGSTVLLNGSGSSSPNGAPLSYAWDLDNDGFFDDASGVTAVFSAASRDDGVYPVRLRVSNGVLSDVGDTAVTVLNVAPQVSLSATSWQILAGQTVTFTGSFNDPGLLDTHTNSWNFGDSSGSATGSLAQSHQYSALGQYTVSFTVTDDDGGQGEAVHSIQVVESFSQFLPFVVLTICQKVSTPTDVILALDISSSMNKPAETGGTRLDAAKQAAETFINLLNFPADQAGLVSFGSGSTLQHPLSTDSAGLINTLHSLSAAGVTRMDLALVESRQELTGPHHILTNTPVIILLTDGLPNGTTPEAVLAEANVTKAAGIVIYTIGLGSEVNVPLMQNMATSPNHYYQAPTTAELIGIYEQIADQIQCGES